MNKRISVLLLLTTLSLLVVVSTACAASGVKNTPEKPAKPIIIEKPKPEPVVAVQPKHVEIVVGVEEKSPDAIPPKQTDTTSVEELLAPVQSVTDIGYKAPDGIHFTSTGQSSWSLSGPMPYKGATVILSPKDSKSWDFSGFSYVRIDLVNTGPGLVWIRGRLDNAGAEDWANSSPSQAFIMPGEKATLGFAYPRSEAANDAPAIFGKQNGKPNGHRSHWKAFDPAKVLSFRLQIESTSSTLSLEQVKVSMAQPYGVEANAKLLELPYLDEFGQVRTLEWPGKLQKKEELALRQAAEEKVLADNPSPSSFNQYGGWKQGPQLQATGFFRTERYNGKWWLVDPTGRLFFSNGANSVWFEHSTPVEADRRALFSWLPGEGDAATGSALKNNRAYFQIANLIRVHGPAWEQPAHDRVHKRLRSWGMNTLGAWSASELNDDARTPYTSILHVGWESCILAKKLVDPFSEEFKGYLHNGLSKMRASQGDDPWCVGVFIDNEIEWSRDIVKRACAASPQQPARQAVIRWLQRKYPTLNQLNEAWDGNFTSWQNIRPMEGEGTPVRAHDIESLTALIAEKYYKECRAAMRAVFPRHLYLGSRIHAAPVEVYRESAKYSDVVSLNHYSSLAGTGSVPAGTDKPAIDSEFHFAAPDRGLAGVGLWPVGDQIQRSRSYVAYVVSGLLNPNIVGTHWFAYADQSGAGRPGENFQVGFVDVTDTPYPMITSACRKVADQMYDLRAAGKLSLLETLESLWSEGVQLASGAK